MANDLITGLRTVLPNLYRISATLGVNRHHVYRVTRIRSGNTFDGYQPFSDTQEELLEGGLPPGVKELSNKDIYRGANPDSELEIGPFTPEVSLSVADLEDAAKGTEVFYIVQGEKYPNGARFEKVAYRTDMVEAYLELKRASDE